MLQRQSMALVRQIVKQSSGLHGVYRWFNKKLSYRRVTAQCVLSVVILPITMQNSAETTYMTSPDQTDGMKLEV